MRTKININNVEFKNGELGQETVQWVNALSAQVRICFLEQKFKKLDVVAPLILYSYEGEGRGQRQDQPEAHGLASLGDPLL